MNIVNCISKIGKGDFRALARAISWVENEAKDYESLLYKLPSDRDVSVVGITGPPGAGKSTLLNALLKHLSQQDLKIALLAVDPSSPFNYGALLGDRIRLSELYNQPHIFIRSLATRGSLGGLSDKIIEVLSVVKAAPFDLIFVETVGVGQSEVEIAGLADTTVVTLVPEAGDEVQTMKAGLMEIADIFVVNKADRAGAGQFAANLRKLVHSRPVQQWQIPVLKTVATNHEGIPTLYKKIITHQQLAHFNTKKVHLLTHKAFKIIQKHRMRDVDTQQLRAEILQQLEKQHFNLYAFLQDSGYLRTTL